MSALIFLLFIFIALAIIAAKSMVSVKSEEMLVVFRLGQLLRVHGYGSGLVFLLPFLDKGVKVNVESIPGWRRLPKKVLEEKAVEIASRGSS